MTDDLSQLLNELKVLAGPIVPYLEVHRADILEFEEWGEQHMRMGVRLGHFLQALEGYMAAKKLKTPLGDGKLNPYQKMLRYLNLSNRQFTEIVNIGTMFTFTAEEVDHIREYDLIAFLGEYVVADVSLEDQLQQFRVHPGNHRPTNFGELAYEYRRRVAAAENAVEDRPTPTPRQTQEQFYRLLQSAVNYLLAQEVSTGSFDTWKHTPL